MGKTYACEDLLGYDGSLALQRHSSYDRKGTHAAGICHGGVPQALGFLLKYTSLGSSVRTNRVRDGTRLWEL